MRGRARTTLLAIISLLLMVTTLVACDAGGGGGGGGGTDASSIAGFKTPNPLLFTPTPTFPPFTVGIWPANYSPGANDTVNFYVICRAQPADMKGPSTPVAGLTVTVTIEALGKSGSGQTDASGLAIIPVSYSNAQSGQPLQVRARVTYQGHNYLAITVFTPDVSTAPSPTVGPSPSATP